MTRFFEECVSQLEDFIREGNQVSFYKYLEGVDVQGKMPFNLQRIEDEENG